MCNSTTMTRPMQSEPVAPAADLTSPHPDDETGRWLPFSPEAFAAGFNHFSTAEQREAAEVARYQNALANLNDEQRAAWLGELEYDEEGILQPHTPNDADWAEYMAWAESVDAAHPQQEEPEPTDAEWAAHVAAYMADHDLAEMPF